MVVVVFSDVPVVVPDVVVAVLVKFHIVIVLVPDVDDVVKVED